MNFYVDLIKIVSKLAVDFFKSSIRFSNLVKLMGEFNFAAQRTYFFTNHSKI